MLAQRGAHPWPGPLAGRLTAANAGALADPVGTGPHRAAQLPAASQVAAVPGAQREVFRLARPVVVQPGRAGKAVSGIGPQGRQLGIAERGADPLGQLRQLVAAPLPHCRERPGIPGQLERDLVGLASAIPAGDRGH